MGAEAEAANPYAFVTASLRFAPPKQRGPADHAVRDMLLDAASEHFSHFGYSKTAVSDLARSIGYSKAYLYQFFESKRAIGDAVCGKLLRQTIEITIKGIDRAPTASGKLRCLFGALVTEGRGFFDREKNLFELAVHCSSERWPSSRAYEEQIEELLTDIIKFGRVTSEFERKTPLDEAVRSILQAMRPFTSHDMLATTFGRNADAPREVISLVLRSLAP